MTAAWLSLASSLLFLALFELTVLQTHRLVRGWWSTRLVGWTKRAWPELRLALVAALLLGPSAGCASSVEVRARTSLDLLADVIDPAWSLAEDACLARQQVIAVRQTSGLESPEATRIAIMQVRDQCDVVSEQFNAIRIAHQGARDAVERGDLGQADLLLDQIRDRWHHLKGGIP